MMSGGYNFMKCVVCHKEKQFGSKYRFFQFPGEVERCRAWIKVIGMEDLLSMTLKDMEEQIICEAHFPPQCISEKGKRLHKVALPTLGSPFTPISDKRMSQWPPKQETKKVPFRTFQVKNQASIRQRSKFVTKSPISMKTNTEASINTAPEINYEYPLMTSMGTLAHNEKHFVNKPAGIRNSISVPLMTYTSSLEKGTVFAAEDPGNMFNIPFPKLHTVNQYGYKDFENQKRQDVQDSFPKNSQSMHNASKYAYEGIRSYKRKATLEPNSGIILHPYKAAKKNTMTEHAADLFNANDLISNIPSKTLEGYGTKEYVINNDEDVRLKLIPETISRQQKATKTYINSKATLKLTNKKYTEVTPVSTIGSVEQGCTDVGVPTPYSVKMESSSCQVADSTPKQVDVLPLSNSITNKEDNSVCENKYKPYSVNSNTTIVGSTAPKTEIKVESSNEAVPLIPSSRCLNTGDLQCVPYSRHDQNVGYNIDPFHYTTKKDSSPGPKIIIVRGTYKKVPNHSTSSNPICNTKDQYVFQTYELKTYPAKENTTSPTTEQKMEIKVDDSADYIPLKLNSGSIDNRKILTVTHSAGIVDTYPAKENTTSPTTEQKMEIKVDGSADYIPLKSSSSSIDIGKIQTVTHSAEIVDTYPAKENTTSPTTEQKMEIKVDGSADYIPLKSNSISIDIGKIQTVTHSAEIVDTYPAKENTTSPTTEQKMEIKVDDSADYIPLKLNSGSIDIEKIQTVTHSAEIVDTYPAKENTTSPTTEQKMEIKVDDSVDYIPLKSNSGSIYIEKIQTVTHSAEIVDTYPAKENTTSPTTEQKMEIKVDGSADYIPLKSNSGSIDIGKIQTVTHSAGIVDTYPAKENTTSPTTEQKMEIKVDGSADYIPLKSNSGSIDIGKIQTVMHSAGIVDTYPAKENTTSPTTEQKMEIKVDGSADYIPLKSNSGSIDIGKIQTVTHSAGIVDTYPAKENTTSPTTEQKMEIKVDGSADYIPLKSNSGSIDIGKIQTVTHSAGIVDTYPAKENTTSPTTEQKMEIKVDGSADYIPLKSNSGSIDIGKIQTVMHSAEIVDTYPAKENTTSPTTEQKMEIKVDGSADYIPLKSNSGSIDIGKIQTVTHSAGIVDTYPAKENTTSPTTEQKMEIKVDGSADYIPLKSNSGSIDIGKIQTVTHSAGIVDTYPAKENTTSPTTEQKMAIKVDDSADYIPLKSNSGSIDIEKIQTVTHSAEIVDTYLAKENTISPTTEQKMEITVDGSADYIPLKSNSISIDIGKIQTVMHSAEIVDTYPAKENTTSPTTEQKMEITVDDSADYIPLKSNSGSIDIGKIQTVTHSAEIVDTHAPQTHAHIGGKISDPIQYTKEESSVNPQVKKMRERFRQVLNETALAFRHGSNCDTKDKSMWQADKCKIYSANPNTTSNITEQTPEFKVDGCIPLTPSSFNLQSVPYSVPTLPIQQTTEIDSHFCPNKKCKFQTIKNTTSTGVGTGAHNYARQGYGHKTYSVNKNTIRRTIETKSGNKIDGLNDSIQLTTSSGNDNTKNLQLVPYSGQASTVASQTLGAHVTGKNSLPFQHTIKEKSNFSRTNILRRGKCHNILNSTLTDEGVLDNSNTNKQLRVDNSINSSAVKPYGYVKGAQLQIVPYSQNLTAVHPKTVDARVAGSTIDYGLPLMNCLGTVLQGDIQHSIRSEDTGYDTIDIPLMKCFKTLEQD